MVREGFKQTGVGLLPEDWDVLKIDGLGDVVRGGSPRPAGDSRYFNGSYIPWLTVASLTNIPDHQLEVTQTAGGLTEAGSKRSRKLESGTVIIANSGATLGIAKVLGITCCANDGIAAIINQVKGDEVYFCQYFNTITDKLRNVIATGNGQPNLNTALIRDISIPFPPLQEQQAIAKALSNVDGLIEGLTKLIAKKRDIKTATMQQLLTGKTRLPGFGEGKGYKQTELGEIPEDWKVGRLQELCVKIQDGTHFSPKLGGNDFLYVTSKNIGFGYLDVSCVEKISAAEHNKIYERCDVGYGDVLLTKDGANTGNTALNTLTEEFSLLSSVAFLRFDSGRHVPIYFLQQILSSEGQNRLKELMVGNAITRLTLGKIKGLKFIYPNKEEEQAIATVLSDMDKEIDFLQSRLTKSKSIKKGMMQELLTGKTRLL